MRTLAAVMLLVGVAGAAAQTPQDFAYRAEVKAEPGLNVLTLTEPVYRAAQTRDLRDLRLFNGRGAALPFAFAAPATNAAQAGRTTDLTLVALPAQTQARDKVLGDFRLRVEKDGDRAVVDLTQHSVPAAQVRDETGGYLFDLRSQRGVVGKLVLRFADDAPDFVGRIDVLGSDDLFAWRTLTAAPLVRNRQFGDTIESTTFALPPATPYVRIAWNGTDAPRLAGARFVEGAPAPELPHARLAVTAGDNAKSWFVDVPPALPVVSIQLRAPADNAAVRVQVYRYDERDPQPRARLSLHARRAPERWIADGPPRAVFRLNRGGEWIESAPFAPGAHATQLRIDVVDGQAFGEAGPVVEAIWQPQRLVFAASEPAPYMLAAGNEDPKLARAPSLDLRAVLSPDDQAATKLPLAQVVAGAALPTVGPTRSQKIAQEASWSRYALWGVLAIAVVGLGFMAWRLAGQLKQPRS